MPTGYTAGVADGSIKTFEEYALGCARAFGACISLRDEPNGTDIPVFEPSDHHKNKIMELEKELVEIRSLTDSQIKERCDEYNERIAASYLAEKERNEARKKLYEDMLEKARAFVAPTPEHEIFATFLIEQLTESIKFDCFTPIEPVRLDPDHWFDCEIDRRNHSLAYHQKAHKEEIERTKNRNDWVNALKQALATTD